MKTLSVILPVYNAALFIEETVDSVLNQTRPADQIIIINDGSTDHSLELLQSFQKKEERIQLLSHDNAGVSFTRNQGLRLCEGDFIALIDADDICVDTRFEKQLGAMQSQGIDICGSWIKTFGRKEREITYPTQDKDLKWNYLFFGRTIPNPTAMLRRSAVKDILYREELVYGEDYGFFLETFIKNPEIKFSNIAEPLVNYRLHAEQASQQFADKNKNSMLLLMENLLPWIEIHPTHSQLEAHYQVWKTKEPLLETELREYLPLLGKLFQWLEKYNASPALTKSYWNNFLRLHRTGFLAKRKLSNTMKEYIQL